MARARADWSSLPEHLLVMITERFETRMDVFRFRAVCNSFRSSIPPPKSCSPFLDFHYHYNLPLPKTTYTDEYLLEFVIKEYTIYAIEPVSEISISTSTSTSTSTTQQSTKTWVVKVKESNSGKVRVLEPFSSLDFKHIYEMLPKSLNLLDYRVKEITKDYIIECVDDLDDFTCWHRKVALSTDGDDELVIITLIDGIVHLWRSRNKEWVRVCSRYRCPMDVIYHNKKFYVLMNNGRAVTVDPHTLKITEAVTPLPNNNIACGNKYFVKSSNDLFMISKYWVCSKYYKDGFSVNSRGKYCIKIFKFDEENRMWNQVRDACKDSALFLFGPYGGCNFFLSAKEFYGCKRNCIYLSDRGCRKVDNDYPGRDAQILSLDNGTAEFLTAFPGYSEIFWPPPAWLVPKC